MVAELAQLDLPAEAPELPDGWRYKLLGDLVDSPGISYGIVQPGSETNDGVPIVRVNNIRNGRVDTADVLRVEPAIEAKFKRSRLAGGEVLLTLVGTLGEVAVAPETLRGWNVARAVGVIPVRPDPGSLWVSICLRSSFVQHCIRMWATTTVQATFNLRDLAKLPIPIPPKETREAIAAVLGALDDKIELNRVMNATLEAMARALFQSWFVDFDPVRTKRDGRQPTGLDPATAAPFPNEFEDSELGPIPKGWTVGKLGQVATNPRRTLQPNEIAPNTPYIALVHMPRRSIELGEWADSADVTSGKFGFRKGEILFGKLRPYFHKVGVAPLDGVCSTDILVIAPKTAEWFGFVLGHASSDELVNFTDLASTGTKMPRTSWTDISSFDVVIPPEEIATAFTRVVRPMIDQIINHTHQSRTLAAIRDTLLPKLLSGELRLSADGDHSS
jgi:type I restriction enzyme S subunit